MDPLGEQLTGVGALNEPARRTLYEYVVGQPDPVSREQAAEAVAMPVHSVKFHLDKLVAAGLLEVEYRRLSGRTGPGAGRPSKLYRRSSLELSVSLPPRSYDLASQVLAAAIERAAREGVPVGDAVLAVAREEGHRLSLDPAGDDVAAGERDDLERVATVLAGHGYEPRVVDETVCLTNCPFDRLAAEHTELVCGMNLSLIDGLLDGLEIGSLAAQLAPAPGMCCVKVTQSNAPPTP